MGLTDRSRCLARIVISLGTLCWGCGHSTNPAAIVGDKPHSRPVAPLFEPRLSATLLDEPDRDRWQQPDRIVRALKLRAGDTVADVGSGSGYLLPHLSRVVGKRGTVYAEEIQPEFAAALNRRAKELKNVRVVLGTAGDPKLPEHSIACFVLLTVYHEVQNPVEFLRTLKRSAKPRARLAVIDFDPDRGGYPRPPGIHTVREDDVLREAKAAGWSLAERHEFISSQFFLVFVPAG